MLKSQFSKIALPLIGLAFSAHAAYADKWPVFAHIKLTPTGIQPTIIVESENETSWTKVRSSSLTLSAIFDIKMKEGEITRWRLMHSSAEVLTSGGEYMDTESVKFERNIETSSKHLGLAAVLAVGACNSKLKTGAEIYKDQYVGITTDLELFVAASGTKNPSDKDLIRSGFGTFPITVKCLAVPIDSEIQEPKPKPPPVADVDDLNTGPKFKVKSANLVVHKPPSNVCPSKGALTAQFTTNFDGKVTFIYRQAGGGKSQAITVKSKKMPNGKFMAVHTQSVVVGKAVDTKYMVEVVGKGIISDWQNFKVPCKIGLGGGGEIATPPALKMEALSAQLGIQGPKTKLCPNTAKLSAWIKTNKAGKIGFRIMRKDGPVGPMVFATAVKSGAGYMATYSKVININGPVNQSYSVLVPGSGGVASNFVPLKASCLIKLPGKLKK